MAKVMVAALMKGGGRAVFHIEADLNWLRLDAGQRQPDKDELPYELLQMQIATEKGGFHWTAPAEEKEEGRE